mgnify:FL=1
MSLTLDQVEIAAEELFIAEKNRKQIGLLSVKYENIDMEDAYKIQKALVQRKIKDGLKIKGWKIGLTSKAMQNALNINIPDSGILFDNMLFEDRDSIPTSRFIETRIEAEIAFVMKHSISGENISRDEVLEATDYVLPALEILDTRILRIDQHLGKLRNVYDTISDNAANAGVVSGSKKSNPYDFDLRRVGAIVMKNGEVEETGLGAGVLNDPVKGIIWLLNRLSEFDQKISAGDIILSGSFIRPIEARKGDEFFADFGEFGTVECVFS